jgi:serine/threonine-protein kinase
VAPLAQSDLLDGRYRVLRTIGSGGSAKVLLAQDERLGRQVAIKQLHADGPADVARRFNREARLGASLNHPNLVAVFDTIAHDEGVLIVMEHVPGRTLQDALRPGPLRPREALQVLSAVAAALDHAHAHGVVHRDVKPANVIMREDGVVKLADLGIATALEETSITRSGIVLGTAAYMAPEQLEGERAGPEADVYALAATAFEALSGERARPGSTPLEIAHRIAAEEVPDLTDAWPEAPPAAAGVLRRGLARRPGDRPPSAGRLVADLEQALKAPAARPRPAAAQSRPSAAQSRPSAAQPRPAEPRPRAERERPEPGDGRWLRSVLAPALLLLAVGVAAIALLTGGDDGSKSSSSAERPAARERAAEPSKTAQPSKSEPSASGNPAPAAAPAPAPAASSGGGAELNSQGYALIGQGRYQEAVPVLQRAVESFPSGTTDLTYAYALYNLGHALRMAGRPDEAIPVLERRLRIPNQQATVERELNAARRDARRG